MVAFNHITAMMGRVQKRVASGLVTDEERVSLTVIRDELHKARAFRLGELFRERFSIPAQYYHRICCLEVQCRKEVCDGEESGHTEMAVAIPELIGRVGQKAIRFIGSKGGDLSFVLRSSVNDYSKHFPFANARKSPYAYLENNSTLILKNSPVPNLTYICVEALFGNPDHPLITGCDKSGNYPLPPDELQVVEELVYKSVLEFYRKRQDVVNDAVAQQ